MALQTETSMRMGATRLGITLGDYYRHVAAGERWCAGHKAWEPSDDFGPNRSRRDGRSTICRTWNRQTALAWWQARR